TSSPSGQAGRGRGVSGAHVPSLTRLIHQPGKRAGVWWNGPAEFRSQDFFTFRTSRLLSPRRPCHRLDGDRAQSGAVIEIDVLHRVVRVVIALPIDVVVLHEQDDGHAGVGENLPVGVVQGA